MNKSPKEKGLDPLVQARRRIPWAFMKFLKIFEVKRSFVEVSEKLSGYVLMWNILGKQVSMMETWKNS